MRAVVGEHGVDPVGNRRNQPPEKIGCHASCGLLVKFGEGKLAGVVDRHEEMQLALLGAHLGDVDVKEPDRVGLEKDPRPRSFDLRQPANLMAPEAAVQRRPRQMRDARLKRVEAVIERQQGVPPEGDDHRLLFWAQDGRAPLLRSHRRVRNEVALAPLGHRLRTDAVAGAQLRDRSRRSLYRTSDRMRAWSRISREEPGPYSLPHVTANRYTITPWD